jgi:hypothetical protein
MTVPVHAQTVAQRNALKHASVVLGSAAMCSKVRPNLPLIWYILHAQRILPSDIQPGGRFHSFMEKEAVGTLSALQKFSEDVVCASLIALYGPNGQNVPHLISQ